MKKYMIADLVVGMEPRYDTLISQSEKYRISDDVPSDFDIDYPDEFYAMKSHENPHLSINDCEYIWVGSGFYRKLPEYDGIMLHSSCISLHGFAYLFSAPSGTGKSTHTALWREHFGKDVSIINDDKPAIRIFEGKVCACGTPFSGKTDSSANIIVPVKGICMLERSKTNSIERLNTKDSVAGLLDQTIRPKEMGLMIKTLDVIGKIVETVPVYKLRCDMSADAVITAYEGMNGI